MCEQLLHTAPDAPLSFCTGVSLSLKIRTLARTPVLISLALSHSLNPDPLPNQLPVHLSFSLAPLSLAVRQSHFELKRGDECISLLSCTEVQLISANVSGFIQFR